MDALSAAMRIAGSGLEAQSARLRVVSENMANATSTSSVAGGDPYQRKTISFSAELDRASGVELVRSNAIARDTSAYPTEFDPSHQAADETGLVKLPNVNMLIEMADMREANRSYEANLQMIRQVRDIVSMTIDLMRQS
ncbi:MAG: flagellar basal body rod protein FlgC [Pseudomonadota bacterium]